MFCCASVWGFGIVAWSKVWSLELRASVSSFVALLLILEMSFYSRSSGHKLKLDLNVTSLLCFRQVSWSTLFLHLWRGDRFGMGREWWDGSAGAQRQWSQVPRKRGSSTYLLRSNYVPSILLGWSQATITLQCKQLWSRDGEGSLSASEVRLS